MKRLTVFLAMLFAAVSAWGQSVKVEGTVLDNEGYPLPQAAVFVKGGTTGVVTDFDGNYSITVPSDAVLVFSFQGYTEREEAVNGRERIDVTLTVDNLLLEESVVVGYGTQKSKDLTAPIVTIKGGELTKQAASSPMAALQGMVSGVQVINSGAPGSTPKVKVRGVGSISDYANPLYVVDGVFQDNIDFLSSNDIESLTVLKDASAAAIYGVRAANGVIIVTTKKGTKDHLSINYEGYAGVQVPINIMPLANKAQYVELRNEANKNTIGWTPISADAFPGDTDWYAELVKPAFTTNHSVDLSGASDNTNYSVGLSYYYQDGIMNHTTNDYDRINIRTRLDQKMTSWLKMGVNSVLSRYKRNNYNSNAFYQAFLNPPVYNVYNESNTDAYPVHFDSPQLYGFANSYGNPIASAYYNNSGENGLKEVLSAYAEFTIIPQALTFKTSYNMDFYFYDSHNYTPEYNVGGSQSVNTSSLTKTFGYGLNQILDNVLTYNGNAERHSWSLMLGNSVRTQLSRSLTGTRNSVPNFDRASLYLVNGSSRNQLASDGGSRYNGVSFFARGTYNYSEKYLATFTLRADGSSKYQQKWGIFPSAGLAWNLTEEDFMSEQHFFDYLKVRASWGMLGNDNVPANSSAILGTSGMGASAVFGDTVFDGVGAQTVVNNYLKWEVVTEANLGVDFSTCSNRLRAEIDVYDRITDNVVFLTPIAAGGGTTNLLSNNGSVMNLGLEMSLNWNDSIGEDFSYNLGLNATFNHNEVTKLSGLELSSYDYVPGTSVNGNYATRAAIGYPIGGFWGYKIDGVYASEKEALQDPVNQIIKDAGYFKYHDVTGDGTVNKDDITYLGSPLPWMILGFNVGLNYKNWDFSMLINAQVGNKILNLKRMQRGIFSEADYDLDFYKNRWTKDNKSNTYPSAEAAGTSFIQTCNEFYLENGSSFNINNIQVGYTFTGMKWARSIRAYVSAQRPLCLFGYNGFTTEIGGSPVSSGIDNSVYPMQSIYTAGVSVNF